LQPDTLIPSPSNPQSWNRYSYVTNRPVNFNDPTGHRACDSKEECNELGITPTGQDIIPFTTDDSWGNTAKEKAKHKKTIDKALSYYEGDKWWSGSTPNTEEWAAYLVYMEGGNLKNDNDKKLMAWILIYKINKYGPSEFTPVTNPKVNTYQELHNFTLTDWDRLVHPDPMRLQEGFDIVREVMEIYDVNQTPPYLYWVDNDEIARAEAVTNAPIEFEYNTHTASTYPNNYLVFLQAYNDFEKVFP
jgi:hypothetical protein